MTTAAADPRLLPDGRLPDGLPPDDLLPDGGSLEDALLIDDSWLPRAPGAGGHRMTVGVRPMPLEQWLTPRPGDALLLSWKRALLSCRRDVIGVTPGSGEAAVAALAALLRDTHGLALPDEPAPDSLRRVATELVEDLCVLDVSSGRPVLVAGSLAMPNRWRLLDKLGRPLQDIHDPVPGYRAAVGSATDRVLSSLRPDRVLARVNWGLLDSPALFQPTAGQPRLVTGPHQVWLRVEHQTLRRLPSAPFVVFGIRTAQERLDTLLARRPHLAAVLAGALAELLTGLPDDLARYKGVAAWRESLAEQLRGRHVLPTDGGDAGA
ncbi:MAG: heme-dependent oxidative N-demethylase subunit alpha family protein [Actinomycetales bacterium]